MQPPVSTKDAKAVAAAVQSAYLASFPEGDPSFVPRILGWVLDCFMGRRADYLAVDAKYHDLEHTLQGTLCLARLLRGRHLAQARPVVPQRMFELGLLAILLHDSGYLKRSGDVQGTGAKYTLVHVERGVDFAAALLAEKHCAAAEITAVQNMIWCTGMNARLDQIPFHDELERLTGFALGTADLLGQMAAEDYVDKLPMLYAEFAEAVRHSEDVGILPIHFVSAAELRSRTPDFWEGHVRPKLDRDFGGLYRFLSEPYPSGPNCYVDRVEANIARLRRELEQGRAPAKV
jgi:hypothetical protein